MGENKPQESITLASANPHAGASSGERDFGAALDAGARTGSGLGGLQKTIAELHNGINVATDANLHLGQELNALSVILEGASDQQRALAERVEQLEAALSA